MKQINLFFISIFLIACSSEADSSLTSSKDEFSSNKGGEQISKNITSNTSPDFTIGLPTKLISSNFTSDMCNLFAKIDYYAGAFLTNSMRAISNNQSSLSTDDSNLPSITTLAVNNITSRTASSGGKIMANGKRKITEKGIVWSSQPHPTIDLQTKASKCAGDSNFNSDLNDLNPGATYYVRAYATNCSGTAYGNELKFKTDSPNATTIELSFIKPSGTPQSTDLFFRLMVVMR